MKENPAEQAPADDGETVLHLRLDSKEVAELDTIVGWMKKDPVLGRLKAKLGREKAIRYAIGQLLAHPPAHAGVAGG